MLPILESCAAGQLGVFTYAQARAAGYTEAEVRARVASGRWRRLRRGAFTPAATWNTADERARHGILAVSAALTLGVDAAVSHTSAAVLLGAPTLGWPDKVQVTRGSGGHRIGGTLVHRALLPAEEVLVRGGIRLTTARRTLVDVARTEPFRAAVVIADGLLRAGLLDAADLDALRGAPLTGRGAGAARRVMAFADGLSDNPGESLSRVAIHAAGLPPPELQIEIAPRGPDGPGIRVDYLWRRQRLVGEFDGRLKYQVPADLYTEKRREDRIRSMGYGVVRWGWAEAYGDFGPTAARIRAFLAAAA